MLDETDCRLLAALQRDGQATAQELGAALNLSASQAGRRRQRLEAEGRLRRGGGPPEGAAPGGVRGGSSR